MDLNLSKRRSLSYKNQSIGFYMIESSVMKELKPLVSNLLQKNLIKAWRKFSCNSYFEKHYKRNIKAIKSIIMYFLKTWTCIIDKRFRYLNLFCLR